MIEELYDLCETLEKDLAKTNEKLRKSGGELSGADLEYVDKLTHSLKSIKTTIAMMEAEEDGYSERGRRSYRGDSYNRGSYARKRDSMGRYTREGRYSRAEEYRSMLAEAMEYAPDEMTREKLRRMKDEM